MKKIVFVLGLSIIFSLRISAQELRMIMADDIILKQKVAEDPSIIAKYMIYEDNLRMMQDQSKTDTLINGKRVIPVVFHIIHVYGAENISDAQIQDGLARLNVDYNLQNTDTADTYPLFKSRAADCEIEFRFAKKDPNGNCTSGIVRHFDPQTNYAYFQTMADYAWPPSKYMNIFVVNFIYPEGMSLPDGAFIGGMSPFPPSNTLTQALTGGDTLMDGVLIRHDGIGAIGTATTLGGMPINAENRTFTHETGHYFNLYHPFQNLMFGLLPASSGCPDFFAPNGDEVDDTPPVDVATQNTSANCFTPGSRNTCDQDSPDEPDMIENYMDYQWGFCTNIFSVGQLDRINTTLSGDRHTLWSYENLIATGVLDTSTVACTPVADFFAEKEYVCAGGSINFFDVSFNGAPNTYIWTFQGGTPSISNDTNPTIQYDVPGVYEVKLLVFNSAGSDSVSKTAYIHVMDTANAYDAPYMESFESITLSNEFDIYNDVAGTWELSSAAAYSGSKSVFINNFDGNINGSYDNLISPLIDLTALPSGSHAKVTFKYAYAGKINAGTIITGSDTAYDKLNVFLSNDCGFSWSSKISLSGSALSTCNPSETAFAPASQNDWSEAEFVITAANLNHKGARLRFEFYSNGGNNLYIDDINVYSLAAGVEEYMDPSSFTVFPNPAEEISNVSFDLLESSDIHLAVYDISGRMIIVLENDKLEAGHYDYVVDRAMVNGPGSYLLKLDINGNSLVHKLIF